MKSGLVVHSFTVRAKSSSFVLTAFFAGDCARMAVLVASTETTSAGSRRRTRLDAGMTELLLCVILSSCVYGRAGATKCAPAAKKPLRWPPIARYNSRLWVHRSRGGLVGPCPTREYCYTYDQRRRYPDAAV